LGASCDTEDRDEGRIDLCATKCENLYIKRE
jgi:hypothetical protein